LKVDSVLDAVDDSEIRKSKLSEKASFIRSVAPLAGITVPGHIEQYNTFINQYALV
jgi:hypothetical protein